MSLGMSGMFGALGATVAGKGGGGGGGGGAALPGTQSNPANNAREIRDSGQSTEGPYYINLPSVGVTQIYCAPQSSFQGGGWMLAWKCTRGSTFPFGSSYWTSTNTLSTSDMSRNDSDAKYQTYNYFTAQDCMAIFPDLNNGGQASGYGNGWSWYQPNINMTMLARLQSQSQISGNPRGESMWSGSGFSAQGGHQWYGFYYTFGGHSSNTRWGFGWNNEGGPGSNDVISGIGLDRSGTSAGDHIYCCQSTTGVNRSIRAEIWVR
jgi:hypothetical protein